MARDIYNSNHMVTKQWLNETASAVSVGAIVIIADTTHTDTASRSKSAVLAIALVDIPKNGSGSVGFNCGIVAAKSSGSGTDDKGLKDGESLKWDATEEKFNNDSYTAVVGDITGSCRADGNSDVDATTGRVWLTGIPGVRKDV